MSPTTLDYVVVGAGYAGLNVLAAVKRLKPSAQVLCIDRHEKPGGCWNDFYDYVALHQPHTLFGVNGQPWHFKDPNILAPRADILHHFKSFVDTGLSPSFEFKGQTDYLGCRRLGDASGLLEVTIKPLEGENVVLQTKHVIDARAFNYPGQHMQSSASSSPEVQLADLPKYHSERPDNVSDRLYVIVGGGKTGVDTALWLADHRKPSDEVLMITGRSKYFFCREHILPKKPNQSLSTPVLGGIFLQMAKEYDGSNETELLEKLREEGVLFSIGGSAACSTNFGIVSRLEMQRLEESTKVFPNDYFSSVEQESDGSYRIHLRSGASLTTQKEVVVVNCRSSSQERANAFSVDVHPLQEDGSVKFGSLLGFTGPTYYLMTTLYVKGKLKQMPIYGVPGDYVAKKVDGTWDVKYGMKVLTNTMNAFQLLSPADIASFTLDINSWAPVPCQMYFLAQLFWNRKLVTAKAEAHLSLLKSDCAEAIAGKDTCSACSTGCYAAAANAMDMLHAFGTKRPDGSLVQQAEDEQLTSSGTAKTLLTDRLPLQEK